MTELVLPNGATQLDTRYLIKTADEEPAYLVRTCPLLCSLCLTAKSRLWLRMVGEQERLTCWRDSSTQLLLQLSRPSNINVSLT